MMKVSHTLGVFSEAECDVLLWELGFLKIDSWDYRKGKGYHQLNFKKSGEAWPLNPDNEWVYNRFLSTVPISNATRMETLFYGVYVEGDGMNWHKDQVKAGVDYVPIDPRHNYFDERLITGIMQLSDPKDHEGGDLQVLTKNQVPLSIPRARGSVVWFQGEVWHRVTDLTAGTRKSLSAWWLK